MDFTLPPEHEEFRQRARAFIAEHVMPCEDDPANYDPHENIRTDLLDALRGKARAVGLWAPQAPAERGGMGLPVSAWAPLYEEANRSIFGPVVLNCAAPDDGNMNVLAKIGTPAQQDWFLQPIIDGKVRSSFAMTEPHPGSGSDPSMMLTTATRNGSKYIINGRKWYIPVPKRRRISSLLRAHQMMRERGCRPFCFIRTSRAGRLNAAFRSWAPKSMAGIARSALTGWRSMLTTC